MKKETFTFNHWHSILGAIQEFLSNYPTLNIDASVMISIYPHLGKLNKSIEVQFGDIEIELDIDEVDDIPLTFVEGLESLSSLSEDHFTGDYRLYQSPYNHSGITVELNGLNPYDEDDVDLDDDVWDDVIYHRVFSQKWSDDDQVTPHVIHFEPTKEELENLKRYNGDSFYYRLFTDGTHPWGCQQINGRADEERNDFTRYSNDLLAFFNRYLETPLTPHPINRALDTESFIQEALGHIGNVFQEEHEKVKSDRLFPPLTTLETWIRFHPSKHRGDQSAIIMMLESPNLHPHLNPKHINKDFPFLGLLMTKSWWLNGVNDYASNRDERVGGWYTSTFAEHPYANQNMREFVSHYFEEAFGIKNLAGSERYGSGMSLDINLSKVYRVQNTDDLRLYRDSGDSSRVYVYTDKEGLLVGVHLEHMDEFNPEAFKEGVLHFIKDIQSIKQPPYNS